MTSVSRRAPLCRHGYQCQHLWSNLMNESLKVRPHHLDGERTCACRAVALGWRDDQIIVIDTIKVSRARRQLGVKTFIA